MVSPCAFDYEMEKRKEGAKDEAIFDAVVKGETIKVPRTNIHEEKGEK